MQTGDGDVITSPRNRWIKLARSLHRRRIRYRERAILVEGVRPVDEALSSGTSIQAVLVSGDMQDNPEIAGLLDRAGSVNATVLTVESAIFKLASDTETPQGVLAICAMPEDRVPSIDVGTPLLLIVDQVRDPGNLGTLLRSALGAGVTGVLITAGTVDPYSPKVLRAGAGSHFRLNLAQLDWSNPPAILDDCPVYVTDASADVEYDIIDWTQPAAIVIGNETSGVSSEAIQRAHGKLGIPLANSLESLNAGVAGSVILFEAWRQRRKGLLGDRQDSQQNRCL